MARGCGGSRMATHTWEALWKRSREIKSASMVNSFFLGHVIGFIVSLKALQAAIINPAITLKED